MKPMAIKWRISLLVAVVLVAIIVTLSCVASHEMEESLKGDLDDSLLAVANATYRAVADAQSPQDLQEDILSITQNPSHSPIAIYRVWLEGSERDIYASGAPNGLCAVWLREIANQAPPRPGKPRFFDVVHGGRYRAVWARDVANREMANVMILRSSEHAWREITHFLYLLLILGSVIVVGSMILVVALIRWAMRPVGQTAALLHDITDRNLGSANLADLHPPAELEPFVDSVSRLLSRLDEAIQRQKQFTSDASHELRTPLTVAKSTLQAICAKDRSPAEYKQAILETVEDLERMEHLTAHLLLLARMDASDQLPASAEVRLDVMLRLLAKAFDKDARQTGGTVVCEEMSPTSTCGNEQYLRHLFENLLDNAVKHGPAGRPVRVTLQHGPDQTCTVHIHDDGHIPSEVLPRLFGRFYRADSSRSRASGGSGLGLAVARKIARLHTGDIEIRSSPASGTDLFVHLPRLAGHS